MKSDNRWIWRTIIGMILVFAAFSGLLWIIGLFDFTVLGFDKYGYFIHDLLPMASCSTIYSNVSALA